MGGLILLAHFRGVSNVSNSLSRCWDPVFNDLEDIIDIGPDDGEEDDWD